MRFAEPQALWLLLLLPLIAAAARAGAFRRKRALRRFAGGASYVARFTGQVSVHRRAAKLLLLLFAVGCGVIALARPQWGTRLEEIRRKGVDVVVAVDTSLSMATEDAAPSRLGQARHEIVTLIGLLAGDRIGLVTFAGDATLACPLTLDHAAVRLFLDSLDVETVPVPGTSLAAALRVAARAFGDQQPDLEERGRAIVLFSDGEDHGGGIDAAIDRLQRRGITLYALGTGTARGAPIPLRDRSGLREGYKKDKQDRIVTSRLDEAILRKLALETGGRYYRTTPAEGEIEEIAQGLMGMDAHEFGATLRRRYEERFQIPLALGLLALLGETLFGDRRRAPRAREARP